MALNLTATVQSELNRVLPLTPVGSTSVVVRLATATSGKMLVIQAGGSTFPASNLNWSMAGNPSWVSLTIDPIDPSTVTLSYTNATPNAQGLHQFYVKVNDGDFAATYAISVDVKKPFYLKTLSSTDTINLVAYDSTISPSTDYIAAYGLSDLEITSNDVYYLQPEGFPDGLEMLIGVDNTVMPKTNSRAILRVAQPTALDASGGVKVNAPYTQSLVIKAYQPNSMYDLPNDPIRTYSKTLTLNVNTTKKGAFNVATSCVFDDTTSHHYFSLMAHPSFAGGKPSNLLYQWSIVSGTGTETPSGDFTHQTFQWAPGASSGNVTFGLIIKDADNLNSDGSHVVLQNMTIGPIPYSNAGSDWNPSNAIKVDAAPLTDAAVGEDAIVAFSTPVPLDTVTLTFTSTDSGLTMPAPLVLTTGSPSGNRAWTIPTSNLKKKWTILVTATSAGRSGKSYIVIESAGQPLMTVGSSEGTSLLQATGSLITPSTLSFTYNSSPIVPDQVYLVASPAGIKLDANYLVSGGSPINTVAGTPFQFKVLAIKAGYSPSYLPISLAVTTVSTPITFDAFYSSSYALADNTPFSITWKYPTTPATLFLQKNIDAPVQVTDHSYQSLTGDAVFSLTGTNFYGMTYAAPFLVVSDTAANLTKLPGSETVATIDSSNKLTLNWSPTPINSSYSLYKGWVINYSVNNGPTLQLSPDLITGLTGGTPAARVYSYQFTPDNVSLSMRAMSSNRVTIGDSDFWPDLLAFPTLPTSTTFSLDKVAVKMGESVTVVMESGYSGATSWRVLYSDGKATDWLPISLKSATHSFAISGQQTIAIELEKVYALTPPITLKRTLSLPLFVEDQTYLVGSVNSNVLGDIGLGGTSGFEITNSAAPAYVKEPYEVVTRSIVKDEVTQELKLLVATARNDNASSVQGTMALDVFPLVGRPHMKNLIAPSFTFEGQTSLVPAVSILSESLPDAVVGSPMIDTMLQATGGTAPYDWYSSDLPEGLVLTTDGTLSGTPMLMGNYSINISVKDSTVPAYIDSKTITMNVVSDITIAEASASQAKVGTFYSHTLPVTGGLAPYSWRLASGELPIGLTIDAPTGKITGYPCTYNSSTDFSKTFLFTPEVTDSIGAKISKQLFMTLAPVDLTLGSMDQSVIYKEEDAKLVIPIYGGSGSYNVLSLSSDGSVGNLINIQSPEVVDVVSGVSPSALVINTGNQAFAPAPTPSPYPYVITFPLSISGGVPGYKLVIDTSNPSLNTLTNPSIVDNVVYGTVAADGHYTVNVKCTDTDGFGSSVSKVLAITVNDNSTEVVIGVPTVSLEFVGIKKNGSNNTATWTFRKLTDLPDAKENTPYKNLIDTSEFFGMALWNNDLGTPYDASTLALAYGELSPIIHAGANAQYTPLGISAFNNGAWSVNSPAGTNAFNSGTTLPAGYGATGAITANNFVFVLFADTTSGAGIPTGNQKIVRTIDPMLGTLTDYQIGTLTYFASNGSPLYSKSIPLYCSTSGGATTPVVCMTSDVAQLIDGDTYDPGSTTFGGRDFLYPLSAFGGLAPYTFAVRDGSTLPGATIGSYNGAAALRVPSSSPVYSQTSATSFIVYVSATDQNGIVSQIIPIVVNYTPKTSATNPVQIVYHTYLQASSVVTPTFRGYTNINLTPLDIQLKANQEVVWSLPANDKTNFEALGLVFTTKPDNSFSISGTPTAAQRYIFNITASAVGSGSDTKTFYLDIVDPIVKVNGPANPLTIGASYTSSTNHSIVNVHIEGYRIVTSPVVLHTNLGVLGATPVNINITSDMGMGNPGNPSYAQKWDAQYDFSSTISGSGLFSVTGAPSSTPVGDTRASFTVAAPALIASGLVNAVQHVSEYAATFAPAPPLAIIGGIAPYTYTVTSLSNPVNFAINGSNQLELIMSSVSPTNQPGTCSVTYTVTDSSPTPITVTSTPGTVSVIVDAESYIGIHFLPKEWVYTDGTGSSFPLFGCLSPQLGHKPYAWAVTSVDLAGSGLTAGFIVASPSHRLLSYNTSLANLPLREFLATDLLTEPTPGVWTSTPTGITYPHVPWGSTAPAPGRYAITVNFTITDAKGLTETGSTTVTLVVP